MAIIIFHRQMPRVKSESDCRKSRRAAASDQNGGDSSSPLTVMEEEKHVSAISNTILKAFEKSPEPEPELSYLEKRRAERA